MSPSTDIAKQDSSTDVALDEREAVLAQLRDQQDEEFDDEPLNIPLLKIGESLTKEVQDENNPAQAGEFINSLTGEPLGKTVDFIIAYYQKGRLATDKKTNRTYVAFGDTIPEQWKDFVGESFVGTPFTEYPDAEEQFKERVNSGAIEWGTGPKVSTTYNYTGLALVPVRDEDDQPTDEFELQPCRISLKRANTASHRKIRDLKRMSLRPPKMFWDRVFNFSLEKKGFTSGSAHILKASLGRATNDDEKQMATELAVAVAAGRVHDNQATAEGDARVEPKATGGLGV
jgi:hypothetical protein